MYKRFHGVDKHSTHLTITIVNRKNEVVKSILYCKDFDKYISTLTEEDAIAIEAGNRVFHLADKMEEQGATPFIINPRSFKLITQSTKKTDKNDSITLAQSLCQNLTGQSVLSLPLVYKPKKDIRELRRMFSALQTLNKSLVQYKNTVIGMLRDSGLENDKIDKDYLFNEKRSLGYLDSLRISESTKCCIKPLLKLIILSLVEKKDLKKNIVRIGAFLKEDVELLISIKGVSPLLALAFLADIGDIDRFKNIRSLNGYLGLVPITKSSGKRDFQGHIIRQSRSLTRTLFTQVVQHIGGSSESISRWYQQVRLRRGVGRGRIALIRQTVKIMRRMLIDRTLYRWIDQKSYETKLTDYYRIIKNKEESKNIA
jgi:transposase